MKNMYTKSFLMMILLFYAFCSRAQLNDTTVTQKDTNGNTILARFKPNTITAMPDAAVFLKKALKAQSADSFGLEKVEIDKFGVTHKRFQQYHKGVIVEDAEYMVHGRKNTITSINGHYQSLKLSSVNPSITESQALSMAINYVGARKYKWQDSGLENFIKQTRHNKSATFYPKGELIITKGNIKQDNEYRLAWKFIISSLDPENEQAVYVDANDGQIIKKVPLILDSNTPLTAQTIYSGLHTITGDLYATNNYRLRETRSGVSVKTLNCLNQSNYSNAVDFTNTNTSWTSGSWTNYAQDKAALDVHRAEEKVLDYWKNKRQRNSIDGNGLRIIGYVHFFASGQGYPDQAQWDSNSKVMRYGDGDGTIFGPMVALDVCGHEIGHGICQYTANLSPVGEAAALNEGLSDIWGACVEHYAAPTTKKNWLSGEDLVIGTSFSCVRDLQNPKSTATLEGQHPDTYGGDFWSSTGEPHTNSTVLSHWFYLLAQGGSDVNDNCDPFNVLGIGIKAAANIVYQAERYYLSSGSDYSDARDAMISAVRDIHNGLGGTDEEIDVTNAWYGVGVGAAYPGSNNGFSISGSNSICSSSSYSISLPTSATVSWTASPSGLVSLTPNGNSVTATKTGDGQGTLTATIYPSCGGSLTVSRTLDVGVPLPVTFPYIDCGCGTNPFVLEPYTQYPAIADYYGIDDGTYVWILDPLWTPLNEISTNPVTTDGYQLNFETGGQEPNGAYFAVARQNGCGTSSYTEIPVVVSGDNELSSSADAIIFSPNPAATTLTIRMNNNTQPMKLYRKRTYNANISQPSQALSGIRIVKIFDSKGTLTKQQTFSKVSRSVQVNISALPSGVYIIKISDGRYERSKKLIIQH